MSDSRDFVSGSSPAASQPVGSVSGAAPEISTGVTTGSAAATSTAATSSSTGSSTGVVPSDIDQWVLNYYGTWLRAQAAAESEYLAWITVSHIGYIKLWKIDTDGNFIEDSELPLWLAAQRLVSTWEFLAENTDHPLKLCDVHEYAARMSLAPEEVTAFISALEADISAQYKASPLLALVCWNHNYVHSNRGFFFPLPQDKDEFVEDLSSGDTSVLEYKYFRVKPRGHSVRELELPTMRYRPKEEADDTPELTQQ